MLIKLCNNCVKIIVMLRIYSQIKKLGKDNLKYLKLFVLIYFKI